MHSVRVARVWVSDRVSIKGAAVVKQGNELRWGNMRCLSVLAPAGLGLLVCFAPSHCQGVRFQSRLRHILRSELDVCILPVKNGDDGSQWVLDADELRAVYERRRTHMLGRASTLRSAL